MSEVRVWQPDLRRDTIKVRVDGRVASARFRIRELLAGLPEPPPGASELLIAAAGAYLADRSLLRWHAADRWTRTIRLEVPATDPESWPAALFGRLLSVLTNDNWTVIPYKSADRPFLTDGQQHEFSPQADCVSLFSGGLDSYGHIVALRADGKQPLAVGHWDMPTLKTFQERMFDSIDATARANGRLKQLHVATVPNLQDGAEPEKSSRSRGILFLAAGTAVAAAAGLKRLDVPENGFIALNSPLTAARAGALSTRSTHPFVLFLVGELLAALKVDVTLQNPLLYCTKGEVVEAGLPAGGQNLASTISCSHPVGDRWRGDARYANCGYCYPCLIRRSGMERALLRGDPTEYRYDALADATIVNSGRKADLFALVAALSRPPQRADVRAVAPLPSGIDPSGLHEMRLRSFEELHAMMDRGLVPSVRARLGL